MLELACNRSNGKVKLVDWRQGSELWHKVEVPKLRYEPPKENQKEGKWFESEDTIILPHRPDAFFTLKRADEELHFFYEADRKNTSTKKHNRKLRAHFHYIVKQRKHQQDYKIKRVRAVLIETINGNWAEELREAAKHQTVSGPAPSILFWFTTSELFSKEKEVPQWGRIHKIPKFLIKPEIIFDCIWGTPEMIPYTQFSTDH